MLFKIQVGPNGYKYTGTIIELVKEGNPYSDFLVKVLGPNLRKYLEKCSPNDLMNFEKGKYHIHLQKGQAVPYCQKKLTYSDFIDVQDQEV